MASKPFAAIHTKEREEKQAEQKKKPKFIHISCICDADISEMDFHTYDPLPTEQQQDNKMKTILKEREE